jgi:hypothetical protein
LPGRAARRKLVTDVQVFVYVNPDSNRESRNDITIPSWAIEVPNGIFQKGFNPLDTCIQKYTRGAKYPGIV